MSYVERHHFRHGVFGLPGNPAGDIIGEILQNEVFGTDIVAIRAALQIEFAAAALRKNKQPGVQQSIKVVAHSQGTMVFYQAALLLHPNTRSMIDFYGAGGQRFVPNKGLLLNSAENYYYANDPIPDGANMKNAIRKTEDTVLKYEFNVHHLGLKFGRIETPVGPVFTPPHSWGIGYHLLFSDPAKNGQPGIINTEAAKGWLEKKLIHYPALGLLHAVPKN